MAAYQIWLDGIPTDDAFYAVVAALEVEENFDLPGAIQLSLPVSATEEKDLSMVSDERFKPYTNLAVVATLDGQPPECIFDGYVLAHKLHVQRGVVSSTLQVWGQDASWLMNLEEKTREWVDVTDSAVANTVFGEYGFDPSPDNSEEDSPSHTETGHSLMQRGTDGSFLKHLARANGKIFRVVCADQPGKRIGYFAKPKLDGDPVLTISFNDPANPMVEVLDFDWDVTRPSAVKAQQALFSDNDPAGVSADTDDSGLPLLDERGVAAFAERPSTIMLTAPVDDGGELSLRAQALLRDAGWFSRCEGEADVSHLKAVLRVGTVVQIDGAGLLNSGKYLVWSVRHSFSADTYKMKFVLMRNALGPATSGASAPTASGSTATAGAP